jgi:signal transduction histidine kinase/DNA-binding response OmpR family regulator
VVGALVASGVATARTYEEERRRAEGLAALDRAKTAFFSNVSHELRTPLTLMLGPAEDALADRDLLPALNAERWELVHRNGRRLSRLVSSLLDFARIEAGRLQASYEPTDLATVTAELAGSFRTAVERAGLRLTVEAPPLPEPVHVDRDLWEKIVLNLLSNALKFTFTGEIAVALRADGGEVELSVRDTGVGIAAEDLPRLFERFHRIRGTRARTHEGSGIGLAFVQELVRLHGGTVRAASTPGVGSTFTVRLPTGTQHLPADRIGVTRWSGGTGTSGLVEEALRWLPPGPAPAAGDAAAPPGPRILVADDNADMRRYVARTLGESWTVETVADGHEALSAARARPPDLIVADVMMPGLDGFELVQALRADPTTAEIPIVLLSARAGEEAAAEGLARGASDYLVKPFSARALVTRVAARLEAARAQRLIKQTSEVARRRLHSFLMEAPAAIAVLRGPTLIYELANERYCQVIGRREVIGRPAREAVPELTAAGWWDICERVYRTAEPYAATESPLHLGHMGGQPGYFNWVAQPTRDADGAVEAVMVFLIDVGDQVQARGHVDEARVRERELRRAAEEANRAKDEFLAILGHELRNPLAPMVTALHLMRLRGGDRIEKERTILERQMEYLTRLVDDLLDVSRITRGKIELKKQECELAEVVARAIEMASPLIEQRQHHLTLDLPRHGLTVLGDGIRLGQVVSNLLTNAAKYTDPGGHIDVTAAREGDQVVLRVRDDGIGITADMLPRVFDLFAQESQGSDRSSGGLGLGLTIVRSLTALHGGSVEAHSDGLRQGSEFVIRLPALPGRQSVAAEDTPAQAPDGVLGQRILIVDDNEDAGTLLAELLSELGYATRLAHDGPSALLLAQQFRPQLAILDIGLPVMDGYEVARRLREMPALRQTRLVALTGYGQESDTARSRAAGFAMHLVKPVDVERLEAIVRQLTAEPDGDCALDNSQEWT